MRALITGMCGFIGHHVAEYLLKETDWELVGLDRLDATSTLHRLHYIDGWGSGIEKRVKFVWHDLRAPINDYVAAQLGQVNVCLHLAASTHVDRSIDSPMGFVLDNVVGTCNLLDWWRMPGINNGTFVYQSTDEVFGPAPNGVAYTEFARFNSGNPYAASKAGAEELVCAYANTYRLRASVVHVMNVIGERQHHEKFLPLVTRKVLLGETVMIHANSDRTAAGTRFYMHAANVGPALKWVFEHQEGQFDKWNVVGEYELDNLSMARLIAEVVGKPLRYEMVDFHSSRPGHDLRYALDGQKLRNAGFEYPLTLKASIERTVKWYMSNREWLGL